MPVLQHASTLDTMLPGEARRRIWSAPDIISHSLITLTLAKLYFASGKTKADTVQSIQAGADLDETFGPIATVVELSTITRIKLELITNTLTIEYRANSRSPARVTIQCASHETADEIYSKLWRRLGDDFEVRGNQDHSHEAARKPIIVIAAVMLCTIVFAMLANFAADRVLLNGESSSAILKAFAIVDWKVIGAIGGGVLAILQVWLYRTLTVPPTQLELVKRTWAGH